MKKLFFFVLMAILLGVGIAPVSALNIAVHVPEKYTDVMAGDRFYFEIDIKYPENPFRKDLRLEYEILKDDELVAQSKVVKAIENQASFVDFIIIPESADGGIHIINIKIFDYENLSEEVGASFHVETKETEQIRLYFFILSGLVVLVGILVIIDINVGKR